MENKSQQLYKNTIIFLIGNIGSKLIQFLLVPLYTYTLTTSQYGTTELVLTLSNLLLPLFSIAIADGLLRYGLDKNQNKKQVLVACLCIAFCGSVVSFICLPIFRMFLDLNGYVIFFLLIMNLQIYSNLLSINLKIQNKNKLYAFNSVLYTFVLGISTVVLLSIFKLGITGYFTSYIIANIISILFLIIVGKVIPSIKDASLDFNLMRELAVYSIPMIFNAISWWIISVSDRLAIDYFLNSSDLGIYGIAAKIPSIITTIVGVFSQAWMISAAVEYDNDRDKKFYAETFERFYGVLFLMITVFIGVLKPFMSFYVSPDYRVAWYYAVLLIASVAFSSIASFYGGIFQAAKRNVSGMVTITVGSILNILLNILLIPKYGIEGAVVATYISWLMVTGLRMIIVKKFFDLKVNYFKFLMYTIITLIESLTVMYGNLILSIFVPILVVTIVASQERELIRLIIKIFKTRFVTAKKNNK